MGKLFKIEQVVVEIHRFEIGGNRKNPRKIQSRVREIYHIRMFFKCRGWYPKLPGGILDKHSDIPVLGGAEMLTE